MLQTALGVYVGRNPGVFFLGCIVVSALALIF